MRYEEFKSAVIRAAKETGLKDYELYYVNSESLSVGAFGHEINEFSSSTEGGVCFRCLKNGRMGYASTEELTEEEAKELVRKASENAAALETEEEEFLGEGGLSYQEIQTRSLDLPSSEEMVQAVLEGQDLLYAADPAVVDGSTSDVMSVKETVAIANSRGLDLSHTMAGTIFITSAVVKQGDEMNDAYEVKTGPLMETDKKELVDKAVSDALKKMGAEPAPTGSYPVVFAPKAMASLLSTFSSAFSSEMALRGLSRLSGKEGEKIASDMVTILDDPFYSENLFQLPFDAEGTPAYTKAVIEKGTLNTLLYNLKTAARLQKETTGNASKRGYDGAVEIRPFTMVLKGGDVSEEELLKQVENGVYIDSLQGMHAGANPISGDFSLQSAGFMIEKGEKTRPVKAFTVAGNFFDLLKNIKGLSDEIKMSGYGLSTTAFASPAVLAEGLSIAGK